MPIYRTETTVREFPEIQGVKIVRNVHIPTGPSSGILLGGPVSTAVVRQPKKNTEYSVWGIHLATDDQLTFLCKSNETPIVTRMVDCRRNSPTLGHYLKVTSYPNISERLVIPRGVAHLPTDVEGLITINTPTLYWDFKHRRRNVNLELDVINVERDRPVDRFPVYDVCRFPFPAWLYTLALVSFKHNFDPTYEAPFVFDRNGKLYVLRKKVVAGQAYGTTAPEPTHDLDRELQDLTSGS
jgi:hypothetical protein